MKMDKMKDDIVDPSHSHLQKPCMMPPSCCPDLLVGNSTQDGNMSSPVSFSF